MFSTLLLSIKNTRLNFRKRLPVGLFLTAAMALLFIGNSIFTNTQDGLKTTYEQSLTGNLALSANSTDGFTLFGSELPLIGQFFKIPIIPNYPSISKILKEKLPGALTLPVIIGGAKLSLGPVNEISPFFAVNLRSYFHFFPKLKILQGSIPENNEPALFLNAQLYKKLTHALGHPPALGEKFLLATAQENTFVLRELPLAGVFAYPVSDQLFNKVILIDSQTGRELNGYYVSESGNQAKKAQTDLLSDDLNDLFSSSKDVVDSKKSGITLSSVDKELKTASTAPLADPGTWNFVLLREASDQSSEVMKKALEVDLKTAKVDVQVRDWRDTAGGNAKIVWFLQLLFNVGLIFISLVACLIVMNSLALSVAERIREIGTLRALGAQKSKVAALIGSETVLLVTGAGILGVFLGALFLVVVGKIGGVHLTNPLIASLFGTNRYVPNVSIFLMLEHFGISLLLGFLSMGLPIQRALKVVPLQAMARE